MAEAWYYQQGDQPIGPVPPQEIKRLARAGELQPSDLLWKEGMERRVAASHVKGLFPDTMNQEVTPPPPLLTQWFIRLGTEELGPMSARELALLAQQGAINGTTPVSSDRVNWQDAMAINGLAFNRPTPPTEACGRPTPTTVAPAPARNEWLEAGKVQAQTLLKDLRLMDFRREIVPIDGTNLPILIKDSIFWFAALLGIVPLLIVTLTETHAQLVVFALFFASVWGVLFRSAIVKHNASWKTLIPALFFTGILGTVAAWIIEWLLLPQDFPANKGDVTSLLKWILVVGVGEELCKFLPAVGYLLWKRSAAQPMTIILIGVFSGLGFAAFENLVYGQLQVFQTFDATVAAGAQGLAEGVQGAMVNVMLRSLSCVFCHAVWGGMFAYFLAGAFVSGRRWGAMILVGLALTAVLHGAYDWLFLIQPTLAALTAGASFMLFYGYVAKLREAISLRQIVPIRG
jgi:RsiW-degrading membrane proteinase PrsW (M82 family)